MFTDSELREMAGRTRLSDDVLREVSGSAPVGLVTSWGDQSYPFRQLTRQSFDSSQPQILDVVVNPGLSAASHETAAGEVFYRDRSKSVTSGRYTELDELERSGDVRILMPMLTVYDGRVMALSTPSKSRSS